MKCAKELFSSKKTFASEVKDISELFLMEAALRKQIIVYFHEGRL